MRHIIRPGRLCIIPTVITITGMHITGVTTMSITVITAIIIIIITMEDRFITGIRILILIGRSKA
jgi:hypothetical protein